MDATTASRRAGVASVVVSLGGVLLATAVSPAFSWTDDALSELGVATTAAGTATTVPLFNGGLIVGALLALAFAQYLWGTAASTLARTGAGSFAATSVLMGGVGVFPAGTVPHAPAALGFFLFVSVTLAIAGVAALRAGAGRYAGASLVLAGANVAVWVAWLAAGGPDRLGVALPEIGGAVILASWVLGTVRHWTRWN